MFVGVADAEEEVEQPRLKQCGLHLPHRHQVELSRVHETLFYQTKNRLICYEDMI